MLDDPMERQGSLTKLSLARAKVGALVKNRRVQLELVL